MFLFNCLYEDDIYHLTDTMETLAVKLERLLEQHLILHRPFVGEGCEIRQIQHGSFQIVFVPE